MRLSADHPANFKIKTKREKRGFTQANTRPHEIGTDFHKATQLPFLLRKQTRLVNSEVPRLGTGAWDAVTLSFSSAKVQPTHRHKPSPNVLSPIAGPPHVVGCARLGGCCRRRSAQQTVVVVTKPVRMREVRRQHVTKSRRAGEAAHSY